MQNRWDRNLQEHSGRNFMKTVTGITLLSLFCCVRLAYGTIYNSNGSSSDVQAKVNLCVAGDTVTLPSGIFSWSSGVTISAKAVKIQGNGSGRIIGRSLTSTTVGTGSNTFTTQSGLSITGGQTLTVVRRADQASSLAFTETRGTFMTGTVTSYSGTTLVLNVTAIGGSGTFATWYIATSSITTVNVTGTTGAAFTLTAPATGNLELYGIKFTSTHSLPANQIYINNGSSTTLIHDCWFQASVSGSVCITSFFQSELGIQFKWENDATGDLSWSTPDTIGARDTTGKKNFYVEDCDFHNFLNAMDFDSNSRVVVRHCLFDNAGTGSHGADTSPKGTRHWEFYNNTFIFEPTTNGIVLNLCWWFFCRGGTGVITDNVMPQLISQDWSHKAALNMIVENIRRNGGPYPCWSTYPAPHSVGQGNNGSSDVLDPIRVWNNTGGVDGTDIMVSQYEPDDCGLGNLATTFTQINRDYYFSTDATAARPGYAKYTYPHPLRGGLPPPQNLHIMP
jgi:hypothetical protein